MSQLEKLQKLAEQQNAKKTNLTEFSGLVCIHLGIPFKPYYPKLKDANGNKQQINRSDVKEMKEIEH